jgi:hypothetical protein
MIRQGRARQDGTEQDKAGRAGQSRKEQDKAEQSRIRQGRAG